MAAEKEIVKQIEQKMFKIFLNCNFCGGVIFNLNISFKSGKPKIKSLYVSLCKPCDETTW